MRERRASRGGLLLLLRASGRQERAGGVRTGSHWPARPKHLSNAEWLATVQKERKGRWPALLTVAAVLLASGAAVATSLGRSSGDNVEAAASREADEDPATTLKTTSTTQRRSKTTSGARDSNPSKDVMDLLGVSRTEAGCILALMEESYGFTEAETVSNIRQGSHATEEAWLQCTSDSGEDSYTETTERYLVDTRCEVTGGNGATYGHSGEKYYTVTEFNVYSDGSEQVVRSASIRSAYPPSC